MKKTVLITGGFGYIGTHACIELLNCGYDVIVVDNKPLSILNKINKSIFEVTKKRVILSEINLKNKQEIHGLFANFKIDLVVHLAGTKLASNFYSDTLSSYQKDLFLTINLLQVMQEFKVNNIIFSSSVLVYDSNNKMPLQENAKFFANNPYAHCKLFIEDLLFDLNKSNSDFNSIILRFFNTVGVHSSGLISDYLPTKPDNLINSIIFALRGLNNKIQIFGNNHDTADGSCERDFIHVMDVARGIALSAELLLSNPIKKSLIFNLCSGRKHSVFEVISVFEKTFCQKIDYKILPNREDDVAISYGDNSLAKEVLGWQPRFNFNDISRDLHRLHTRHNK